jgi:drug/metabolite transporter (DMT)-like permease
MAFTTLFNTLSVVLFATLFGGESLTQQQIIGAIILFASVIVVGLLSKKSKKSDDKILVGIGIALFSALLLGPAIMNEKYLIQTIGLNTYVLYGWGLQAFFAYTIAFFNRDKTKEKQRLKTSMHLNIWLVGVLLGLAGFSYVSSVNKTGTVSVVALSGTAVVGLTVFGAYFILREKDHLLAKITGLLLSAIGLFLLFSN